MELLTVLMMPLVQQRKGNFNLINITKAKTKFALILHYNSVESFLYVNKTEICKFKVQNKVPWYLFCLGGVSKDFTKYEMKKNSLSGSICDISDDRSLIEKEDVVMKKNDVK